MDATKAERRATVRSRLRYATLGLTSAAVVGLMVGMGAVQATDGQPAAAPATQQWQGYADLIEQVMPSVVAITAQRAAPRDTVAERGGGEDPEEFFRRFGEEGPGGEMFERFMRRFFGEEMPDFRQMPPRGFTPPTAMGSGFIVDAEGYIVTNFHVVDGAEMVTVTLEDGTELTGEVVGTDPDTDLALVQVETDEPLQAIDWADSESVRVGDPVVAIGSPFGLGGTVTAGIVSADHRSIGAGRFDEFLQIDAPINRGNSGGPAFNTEGQVIGVNTAIHSPSGGNVGIGFAIPANLAKDVIEDLKDDGEVTRGWLGVYIQGIDDDLAASFGLDEAEGALVARITADSPAASAGLEQGDVIVSYNGEAIESVRDLTRKVARTDPGTSADLVVLRDGEEVTLGVDIGRMPSEDQQVARAESPEFDDGQSPRLGVALAPLTPEARAELDLGADVSGVVVSEVQPGSPAAEKGLRPGDLILEVDRTAVSEPGAVSEAVQSAVDSGEDAVLLLVRRDGQERFVAVPLARG